MLPAPNQHCRRVANFMSQGIHMSNARLSFDHVHVISKDPATAAGWYVDKLGGVIIKDTVSSGAPQITVAFGSAAVIVRGHRPAEQAAVAKPGLQWGVDHFGFQVQGDFDDYCAGLRDKGVAFSLEPTDINPTTRIAFINAPDDVSVELLRRRDR